MSTGVGPELGADSHVRSIYAAWSDSHYDSLLVLSIELTTVGVVLRAHFGDLLHGNVLVSPDADRVEPVFS